VFSLIPKENDTYCFNRFCFEMARQITLSIELNWQPELARYFKTEPTEIVAFCFGIRENTVCTISFARWTGHIDTAVNCVKKTVVSEITRSSFHNITTIKFKFGSYTLSVYWRLRQSIWYFDWGRTICNPGLFRYKSGPRPGGSKTGLQTKILKIVESFYTFLEGQCAILWMPFKTFFYPCQTLLVVVSLCLHELISQHTVTIEQWAHSDYRTVSPY
jgi:hypothetical protein